VLITSGLMVAVYTIVEPAAEHGWGARPTLTLAAASLVLVTAFVARQATARNPLIPLRIFSSRNVSGANLIQALTVAGMFATFFLGALYLQRVLRYDALEIGLAFLPTTLVMGTLSLRYSERLIMRHGARATLLPGLGLIAVGLGLFARAPVDGSYVVDVLPTMLLIGGGVGVSFPALMTLSMSGATPQDAGLASGLVNTTVQVGGALGLAVLATLASTRSIALRGDGRSAAAALTGGYHLAYVVGALLVLAAIVVALTVLQGAPKRAHQEVGAGEPAYSEAC
jgi:predicted MFS family arabinose efflux permease